MQFTKNENDAILTQTVINIGATLTSSIFTIAGTRLTLYITEPLDTYKDLRSMCRVLHLKLLHRKMHRILVCVKTLLFLRIFATRI